MCGEEFGINILSVQEIRGWEPITEITNSPKQVLGIMNLRGTVSPIIDLRHCFGIVQLMYSEETVVIIVSVPVKTDKKPKVIAVIVDSVSNVYNFFHSQIQASPELAQTHQAQYLRGLGSTENKMVIILDLTSKLIADIETSNNRLEALA
jgi:purine-binding chemotaxis protein CheW